MKPKLPFTGMVLAGGRSSRMGQDKAFLKFGERTMIEHLAGLLGSLFEETFVLVDSKEKFDALDLGKAKIYEDLFKKKGPLAGIYTGLCYSRCMAGCVLTCDMPFVDEEVLRELVDFWQEGHDALCLEDIQGVLEPFPGIYARSSRHIMRLLLERGEASMRRFLELAVVKPLVLRKEKIQVLANMNTIEDYYRVLAEKAEWAKE